MSGSARRSSGRAGDAGAKRLDGDPVARTPRREHAAEVVEGESDAARRRRPARPRDMQEDRAAEPGDRRRVVVADHREQVVAAVLAPQGLGLRRVGQAHAAVVERVAGGGAPAVAAADRRAGETGRRRREPVGAVKHPAQCEAAGGRLAVALALGAVHPAAPDRAAHPPPVPYRAPRSADDQVHDRTQ